MENITSGPPVPVYGSERNLAHTLKKKSKKFVGGMKKRMSETLYGNKHQKALMEQKGKFFSEDEGKNVDRDQEFFS